MKALQFQRKPMKYAASMVAGTLRPGRGAAYGPLDFDEIDEPELPGADWQMIKPRLAGICGSDLATIDGRSSRYFEDIVSFPFVPGHEVVADAADGTRVVLEPVLGCVARNVRPVCVSCSRGDLGNCERLAFGDIAPGLQTGFCCDTGGGWGTRMVAHASQLHVVADTMTDEAAVMVEPTACAIHAALAFPIVAGDLVVVLGAGTLGLLTIAAVHHFHPDAVIVAGARYLEQRRWAKELGATHVVEPDHVGRLVRRLSGSLAYGNQLTGGANVVLDCVGTESSITEALRIVKPRGRITLVGMPNNVSLNLTSLWHRETQLAGAYAYGTETLRSGDDRRTFDLAFELVGAADLGRLVTATYPLRDYRDALEHAATAGRRGAVRIAFDLRHEKGR